MRAWSACLACGLLLLAGCGGDEEEQAATAPEKKQAARGLDRVVKIDVSRGLYVRCTGKGSPTVVMEAGDQDTSDSYLFAGADVSRVTRACVYDRANLGQSDPAPGPRGLKELVDDLERLLDAARIGPPYVLVGTSGGGYISAGYATRHPDRVAGMAFIEVPAPFRNPPAQVVRDTDPSNPDNVEKRDYLQVEKDAWAARKRIGDIPVTVVSNEYSEGEIAGAPTASERRGMRRNVKDQKGWLVLSPQAKQVVVHTGHTVEEEDPELVIDVILDVVHAARG
jgi:pimeloyl-ACP methyl ester carboxylesterase